MLQFSPGINILNDPPNNNQLDTLQKENQVCQLHQLTP